MKPTIAIMALLLASPAWAEGITLNYAQECPNAEPSNWHLLTKSHSGTVSLIKGLTEKECRFMENRAMERPATDEEKEVERKRQEEAARIYAEQHPRCPGVDGDATQQQWKEWRDVHPNVSGCTTNNGSIVWGGTTGYTYSSPQPSDIVSAECFQ